MGLTAYAQEEKAKREAWYEIGELRKRIAEIEKERAVRDLEQQAKGVEWVLACRELNLSEGEVHTLMDKCNQLRKQDKALKEKE
jgi:hypothetical protein